MVVGSIGTVSLGMVAGPGSLEDYRHPVVGGRRPCHTTGEILSPSGLQISDKNSTCRKMRQRLRWYKSVQE